MAAVDCIQRDMRVFAEDEAKEEEERKEESESSGQSAAADSDLAWIFGDATRLQLPDLCDDDDDFDFAPSPFHRSPPSDSIFDLLPPSSWLPQDYHDNIGNAQKEEGAMMEVDSTFSPGGPLGSAPRYSPITPEAGTPAQDQQAEPQAGAQAHGSPLHLPDTSDNRPGRLDNGPPSDMAPAGDSQGAALLDASQPMNNQEKVQLAHAHPTQQNPYVEHVQSVDGPVDDLNNLALDPFEPATEDIRRLGSYDEPVDGTLPPVMEETPFTDPAGSQNVEPSEEPSRIRAFAKLEFDDGQFYMNTYSIEIGRDNQALKKAQHTMLAEHHRRESESSRKEGSNPDPEKISRSARHEAEISAAASVISGGIMHIEHGDNSEELPRRRKKRRKSRASRHNPNQEIAANDYQALANASLVGTQTARPVDLTNMMPSPDECPLIPIHPPPIEVGNPNGFKGISRRHVRIAYNQDRGLFEIHVMGRNGCFVDDAYVEKGGVQALASGTIIQVGGVSIKFVLPNVPDGETGTDLRSDAISQSGISYDFEDGYGEHVGAEAETPTTDNEDDRYRELRAQQKAEREMQQFDDDEDDEDEDEDDLDDEDEDMDEEPETRPVKKSQKQTKSVKAKGKQPEPVQHRPKIKLKMSLKRNEKPAEEPEDAETPIKRKGPGRPPKNGIMSKREQAEIKRKEKEAAKAKKAEEAQVKREEPDDVEPPVSPTEKRKAQKKQKEEEPSVPAQTPTPAQEDTAGVIQSIEKVENEAPAENQTAPAPKPPKEKRPPKPPRSPSPIWDEASLTAEQLAKPTQSYVVLIHEALSNHPKGQMSLPQIYRAIERKYPYYKFKVQTVGWQSSVRHNLSQHQAFVRIERDGKGWMWGLDKNVSIEREKKRRPSPPPMQASHMYGMAPGMFNRGFQQTGFAGTLPNGQGQVPPQNPYAVFPHPPQAGRGYPTPNSMQRPPYTGTPQGSSTPGAYQSPYDTSRNNAQQGVANSTQNPNQPATQTPQMPPPYLNQNRPGQPGQSATAPAGQPITRPNQTTLPPSNIQAQRPGGAVASSSTPGQPGLATAAGQSPAFSPPPAANSASPAPNVPQGIPPAIWNATDRFCDHLKGALAAMPDIQAMLMQAKNKCLGIPAPPGSPYKTFPKEKTIMDALIGMLRKMNWPVDQKIAYATGQPIPAVASSVARPGSATASGTQPIAANNAGKAPAPSVPARPPPLQAGATLASSSNTGTTPRPPHTTTSTLTHGQAQTVSQQAVPSQVQSSQTSNSAQTQQEPARQPQAKSVPTQPPMSLAQSVSTTTPAQAQPSASAATNTSMTAPPAAKPTAPVAASQASSQVPGNLQGQSSSPAQASTAELGATNPTQTPSQNLKRPRSPENAGPEGDGAHTSEEPAAKREKLES